MRMRTAGGLLLILLLAAVIGCGRTNDLEMVSSSSGHNLAGNPAAISKDDRRILIQVLYDFKPIIIRQ